jgi:uncharacterized protein YqhQ
VGNSARTPVEPPALAAADKAFALPRLGGMARPDGVVIVSEHHWAFARLDGTLKEGTMPRPPEWAQGIPLLRGLTRLGMSLSPLFSRSGATRGREKAVLALGVAAPFGFVFLSDRTGFIAGIAITVALLAMLLRGRALALHGAEHRAIAAVEERRLAATWRGDARPTRFSPRCGTNFAAIALPVTLVADRFWPLAPALWTPAVVTAVSLALSMELWRFVQASARRPVKALLLPGLGLQRLTTREPRLDETRVALAAVESVLRRELA